jgi:RNA methyltransferase, TrmH family
MLNKNEIKYIQSLSHKKFRDELNLFVAEGPKIVGELLQLSPGQIQGVYATGEWIAGNNHSKEVIEISDIELEKLSALKTPNQVIAVVKKFKLSTLLPNSFTIYLDAIQDPGNFGTIIRTADWFGVKQVVCGPGCADLYNPKVVQSTMASIARVNVYYDEEKNWLTKQNVEVYAAVLDGEALSSISKTREGILIIGNESQGIGKDAIAFASRKITIPGKGGAESLNAAVATGIILSHLLD